MMTGYIRLCSTCQTLYHQLQNIFRISFHLILSTPNTPAAHNMHFPNIVTIMSVLVMVGLTIAVSRGQLKAK